MVEWLNQNQGFAIALLTFVYVIATIFLAYIALRKRFWNKDDSIPNWLNVISKEIELLRKSVENLKDG